MFTRCVAQLGCLRVIGTIEAKGRPEQRITDYVYDAANRIEQVIRRGDAVTEEAVTQYDYDDVGRLTQVTDPEAGITRFEDFDATGNARRRIDAATKTWLSQLRHGWEKVEHDSQTTSRKFATASPLPVGHASTLGWRLQYICVGWVSPGVLSIREALCIPS